MRNSHPIHKINLSSDILDCLLEEFDGFINSKRLRSRISKISELIDILCKRNIFSSNQCVSSTIFKYISTGDQRDIIRNYIEILSSNENVENSGNVYGLFILINFTTNGYFITKAIFVLCFFFSENSSRIFKSINAISFIFKPIKFFYTGSIHSS